MTGFVERLRRLYDVARDALYPRRLDRARREILPIHLLRLSIQVGRQVLRARLPIQAAALAFQTLLSIVPMLAVAFWGWRLLRGSPEVDDLERALSVVLPRAAGPAAGAIARLSASVDTGALGAVGLVSLVLLSFMLLHTTERVFSDIWHVRARRPIIRRLVSYWAVLTLTPVLLGLSVRYARVFLSLPAFGTLVISFALTALALFHAYWLLPATRVRTGPALLGAIVAGVLFEAAKLGFGVYAGRVATTYVNVYGAIAFFPIFCIWIYLSWLIVLFGVELAYTKQHLYLLWERDRRNQLSVETEEPIYRKIGPRVALRVLLAVAERFASGGGATAHEDLAVRFRLQADVLDAVADVLVHAGVLLRTENALLPSRPLSRIRVDEIYGLFEGPDVVPERPSSGDSVLDEIFARVGASVGEAGSRITLADLVERASRVGGDVP